MPNENQKELKFSTGVEPGKGMATKQAIETCANCQKKIVGRMVACLFEGRVLCVPCDRVARAEQRQKQTDATRERKVESRRKHEEEYWNERRRTAAVRV